MAVPQMDYQTATSLDSLPAAKKRKRGANSEDANSGKRGDLSDLNGAMASENGLPDANQFADPNSQSNPFPDHSQQSHDENAAMAAALQAHGQQMSNYSSGIQQSGFEIGSPGQGAPSPYIDTQFQQHVPQGPNGQGGQIGSPTGAGGVKPTVGSEEWHKVRRDNHKEVERRRRETINEGINELAKIVPGNEKNKGSILARTVTYIRELQANQATSQDQRTLERQLLEQAVDEFTTANDKLKQRNHELESECEVYRSSVVRLMQKVKDLGGNLQEEEAAGVVAKIEDGKH